MPFVFLFVGLLFLVTAIRGTDQAMFALVKSEFWGANSFVPWAAAILILAMVGYVKTVKPIADGLILLVILAMVVANKGGFFNMLNQGLKNPVSPAVDQSGANSTSGTSGWAPSQPAGVPSGTPFSIPNNGLDVPSGGASGPM
jgi:hypothetical protein